MDKYIENGRGFIIDLAVTLFPQFPAGSELYAKRMEVPGFGEEFYDLLVRLPDESRPRTIARCSIAPTGLDVSCDYALAKRTAMAVLNATNGCGLPVHLSSRATWDIDHNKSPQESLLALLAKNYPN